MDPEIEKLKSDIANLQRQVETLDDSFNFHAHGGYDNTAKIDVQKQKRFVRYTLVDQATIVVDASIGNAFSVTLGGSRTLGNPTGAADGQRIIFELIQDGTGSRLITLGSKYVAGGFTITLTTTASKRDYLEVFYNQLTDKFYVINFVKNY